MDRHTQGNVSMGEDRGRFIACSHIPPAGWDHHRVFESIVDLVPILFVLLFIIIIIIRRRMSHTSRSESLSVTERIVWPSARSAFASGLMHAPPPRG